MVTHPVDVHVGARLKLFRIQRRISQTKLGDRVGVTFQQIQKYEKGSNRISCSKLFEFAELLNVSVQDFFTGLSHGGGGKPTETTPIPEPSKLDYEILGLLGQIHDGPVKRRLRGVVIALASGREPNSAVPG